MNEPAVFTDMTALFDFYREVRKLVKKYSPHGYFVFHDAFHFNHFYDMWNELFDDDDIDRVAIDHHKFAAYAAN